MIALANADKLVMWFSLSQRLGASINFRTCRSTEAVYNRISSSTESSQSISSLLRLTEHNESSIIIGFMVKWSRI